MKIAVASGKGGTGKSTVSINLAWILSEQYENVCLLDCDVEEPNCHIFLNPKLEEEKIVYMPVPKIDSELCTACGKCSDLCEFNALACIKGKVLVFPELCHGCGGCMLVCPAEAIQETGREVGVIESGRVARLNFIHGRLRIGEAMSPPLIKQVKASCTDSQVQVLDCPPGTSCPVISAISNTDYVILVTEPTPFGLYDLKLAADMVKELGLPFGIVINKSGDNDHLIEEYASKENIKILAKIPDDRRIAEAYSRGEVIIETLPEYREVFSPLIVLVTKEVKR